MSRLTIPVLLALMVPCVANAQKYARYHARSIFEGTPIDNTPIDPDTHNPVKWLPKPAPHGSTLGVEPNYSSELTLKNHTGSRLTFEVTAFQSGRQPVKLFARTLDHGRSTTWSINGMRDITLVSVRGRAPGSSVTSLSVSVRPTNRQTKSYGAGGASPGSVVISQDIVLSTKVTTIVDFNGKYDSDKGFVQLAQNGNHVNGIVTYRNGNKGVISGRVRGNRLEYQWQNAALHGNGVLTMQSDGRTLSGSGSDNRGGGFTWNLRKR